MKEPIVPFVFHERSHCYNCGKDELALVDSYKNRYPMNRLLKNKKELDKIMNARELMYIRCLSCGQVYIINWEDGVPSPMSTKMDYDKFLFQGKESDA